MSIRYSLSGKIRIKQLLAALPFGSCTPVPFIILSAGRAGSTLLHTMLNSHWNILSRGEYMGRKIRQGKAPELPYIFEKKYLSVFRATGMKVFYDYYDQPGLHEALNYIEGIPGLRVIHLVRENLPEQYLSLIAAQRSGEWTGPKRTEKLSVDPADCLAYCHAMVSAQEEFDKKFAPCAMLKITYENLVYQPVGTQGEVLAFLGVPERTLQSILTQQRSGGLSDRVGNYQELKEAFQHTPWERFFS